MLAVLPQFVVPSAPLVPQYLAIGATMVAVDLVVMGGYAALASRVLRWLTTPRQQTVLNRVFSGLFATAAVVLSLVRRGAAGKGTGHGSETRFGVAGSCWSTSSGVAGMTTTAARVPLICPVRL